MLISRMQNCPVFILHRVNCLQLVYLEKLMADQSIPLGNKSLHIRKANNIKVETCKRFTLCSSIKLDLKQNFQFRLMYILMFSLCIYFCPWLYPICTDTFLCFFSFSLCSRFQVQHSSCSPDGSKIEAQYSVWERMGLQELQVLMVAKEENNSCQLHLGRGRGDHQNGKHALKWPRIRNFSGCFFL